MRKSEPPIGRPVLHVTAEGKEEFLSVQQFLRRLTPEENFDPFEAQLAKLDRRWARASLLFRSRERKNFMHIAKRLQPYRERIERGETIEVLRAIARCTEWDVPLPDWLVAALRSSLDEFYDPASGVRSLDEVFHCSELSNKTAKQAAASRQNRRLGQELFWACVELAHKDASLTSLSALVKAVLSEGQGGRPWGVQFRTAYDLVKRERALDVEMWGRREKQAFARLFENRRKPLTP